MPYKKDLPHVPENELLGVGVIGSWVLDNATIDPEHQKFWERAIQKFRHAATREAALFFLHGIPMSNQEAIAIVKRIKEWHGDKHKDLKNLHHQSSKNTLNQSPTKSIINNTNREIKG